jgi:SAM-dependent methyltransferase
VAGNSLQGLKTTAKRSRLGVVAGRIAVERSRDVRRMLGARDGPMGATHRRLALEESVDYINDVFDDYVEYGELGEADLNAAEVLELGPGDNLGVALRFLGAGAGRVVATDRFVPFRDPEQELRIYGALIAGLPEAQRARLAAVAERGPVAFGQVGLELLEQTPIEQAPQVLGESGFDLVVSRAVLEHVHDLDSAFEAMDALLRPGGKMIHKVDLRDHGLFSEGGQNPLTFLTISDRVYGWMGEESAGLPNRRMIGWYQAAIERLGYQARCLITHLAGREAEVIPHVPVEHGLPDRAPLADVAEIRPRLAPRFRALSDEELAIAGFMIVARKPPADS